MYKVSKYNCFVPYKDRVLYFNTLTKSNFTMTSKEHNKMKKMFADPISFFLEYPSIFKQFYKWGFFIESDTNELSIIRYKYYEALFSDIYHIRIINSLDYEITEDFIESLKSHIKHVAVDMPIKSICLEWRGKGILDFFDKYINPATEYAKKICKARGLELINQIQIQASTNEVLHNKLYHDNGLPTHHRVFDQIYKVNKDHDFQIKLNIKAFPYQEEDAVGFLLQFENIEKIFLIWEEYKTAEEGTSNLDNKKNTELFSIRKTGNSQKTVLNSTTWKGDTLPRLHYINLYPNGDVFTTSQNKNSIFHREQEIRDTPSEGVLTAEGIVNWNILKRELVLSQPWFENHLCTKCKYLPIFINSCINNKLDSNKIMCPIQNNLIDPDSIIIQMYEGKEKI